MDVQAAPPTYTPAGGVKPPAGNPPVLGQQVPGTTGGLPSLGGLSVAANPMAEQLRSYGRGEDTMLVHMTPNEVNSLQGLAMAHGGSLTINPHTGLPEAGWLGKLLPTILGFAGAAFGLPTWALALGGTAAGTAATGNLGQGLMMGLQAYGGASLAGGLGVGEAGKKAAELAAKNAGTGVINNAADTAITMTRTGAQQAAAADAAIKAAQTTGNVVTKAPGMIDKFTAFSKAGLPGGIIGKAAPYAAGMGLMSAVSDATQPNLPTYNPEENKFKYVSMAPAKRAVQFQTPEQMRQSGGAEFQYITPNNPEPVPVSSLPLEEQKKYTYADGGMAKAPPGFEELVASYAATNPGAITASAYYPSTPSAASATEKKYFAPTTAANTPLIPPTTTGGTGGLGAFDLSNLNLSGIDWSSLRNDLGINDLQQQIRQQPTYEAPDLSGIYGRLDELSSRVQSLPTEQPVYQVPDLSGIYGRLDELGSRVQSLPTNMPVYETPDLSGIYGRLDELGSRVQSLPTELPTYQAPDLSGIYDRFGAIESKLQAIPTQQPTYQAPDLSGIYDRFGQLESRLNSMPTYQAPDLSGLYGRLDQLESRLSAAPTYQPSYDNYSRGYMDYSGFARGGDVNMRDGAFVVDARTVSELGNGSSNAGMELLSRMGGQPVRGPGDGVSDSVPASIGGKQEARVARDEVVFQPDAVRRIGGGNAKRGTEKLYALMDKAHKARKKAKRGQDTKLRKGLA